MAVRLSSGLALVPCLMLGWGCSDKPAPPAPPAPVQETAAPPPTGLLGNRSAAASTIDTSPMTAPPADNVTVEVLGLTGTKPATWIWTPPTRSMRKANFTVPGPDGSDAAELVITHFPEAPGNTIEANISRWAKQFRTIDGGTPVPTVDAFEADSMNITVVELHGEYMGMGGHWHKANHAMVVAIVEAPAGTVFVKMLGPDATVAAHHDGYMEYIRSLRRLQ